MFHKAQHDVECNHSIAKMNRMDASPLAMVHPPLSYDPRVTQDMSSALSTTGVRRRANGSFARAEHVDVVTRRRRTMFCRGLSPSVQQGSRLTYRVIRAAAGDSRAPSFHCGLDWIGLDE